MGLRGELGTGLVSAVSAIGACLDPSDCCARELFLIGPCRGANPNGHWQYKSGVFRTATLATNILVLLSCCFLQSLPFHTREKSRST